ncbi:4819_t:CDS:2 [Funneliformis geosporum]|uniref:4819_t:CDS:1 n=1 Tax=Funneliformis geosporum TaxID=1117311 RepID=A0A9W4SE55_9GLOM|nr:4819_t:CDS:2 [Funneliformis geosporum]
MHVSSYETEKASLLEGVKTGRESLKTAEKALTEVLRRPQVSFIPVGRYAHSSVLVGDKLYFFGGMNNDLKCLNEVFYLDVSRPFKTAVPPWVDLTQNAEIPFKSCWATVSLNAKEQIIYLFGGFMDNSTDQDAFVSSIYTFGFNTLRWNIPNIRGILPERRRKMKSIIDVNTGKIYIFGGQAIGATVITLFNDMVILNTVESSWLNNPPVNSPSIRTGYTATLLTSGIIAYIGGMEMVEVNTTRLVDIRQIYLYDTNSLTWSEKVGINIICFTIPN